MTREIRDAVVKIAKHFWRDVHWVKGPRGPRCVKEPLTVRHIEQHVSGGAMIGLAPITPGTSTTRIALLDLDSHKGDVPWKEMCSIAIAVDHALRERGLEPIPFRSSGGKGVHLYMLWEESQDAFSVRALLASALSACGLTNGTKGVKAGEVEIFPKQDSVPPDGFGSMWVLPLAKESIPLDPATFELQTYEYAESAIWPLSKPVPVAERPVQNVGTCAQVPTEWNELRSALAAIPNEGDESLDYDAWRNVIFAIHHETDGSAEGLALAHEFSKRSTKYDPAFLDERVWPYVRSERGGKVVTGRTLFALARDAGWEENILDDFEALEDEPEVEAEATERAGTPATATGAAPARFRVLPALEFSQRPPPEWIMDDVLPRAELAVVFGEAGSGKSFLALDMVGAIARGAPWRGRPAHQGNVVYIAAEGAAGFRNRLVAYALHHGLDLSQLPLGIIPESPNILEQKDVKQIAHELAKHGKVDVVVLDTFAQATPGANENSGEDVGKALAHCRALHRRTGALIVLIHHAGKDLSKGARGWSGLRAAADAEIEVSRSDDARCATVTKLKDGQDGAQYPFRLNVVVIGEGKGGKAVDSCIVEHVEKIEARKRREPKGENARLVWRIIHDMIELGDGAIPVDAVITTAAQRMPYDPAKRNRNRELATKALRHLADEGWVLVNDEAVEVRS